MRADWTASGACTGGSTAPRKGARRRASGGATTTSTTRANRKRWCPGANARYCRREIMSEAYGGGPTSGAIRYERDNGPARGAADWLSLAAAPTFAIMALLTAVVACAPGESLCVAAHDLPPSGLGPIFVLLLGLPFSPWLELL